MADRMHPGRFIRAAALVVASCVLSAGTAMAAEARALAEDPVLEARVQIIASELRCLVCQNETLAASQSALAIDLKGQIGHQLAAGKTDDQIRDYMVARYGEFVLYRPAFSLRTALLWIGPFLLLGGALLVLVRTILRHARGAPMS